MTPAMIVECVKTGAYRRCADLRAARAIARRMGWVDYMITEDCK